MGWILEEVFTRYKNKYGNKAGDKPFFGLEAFRHLIKDLDIADYVDNLNIGKFFNLSTIN